MSLRARLAPLLIVGSLAASACLKSEPIDLPPPDELAGATTLTLFATGETSTRILDLSEGPPSLVPISGELAASLELWLHACDRRRLRAPERESTFLNLTADEGAEGCRRVGAPCPIRALRLEPDRKTWSPIASPAQPWTADARADDCATFGPVVEVLGPEHSISGGVSFVTKIGAEGLFEASTPNDQSRLDVWSLPPGPLPDPSVGLARVTTSTESELWSAALSWPDGRVAMVARSGTTAIARLEGDQLVVEIGAVLASELRACTEPDGQPRRDLPNYAMAGGMTPTGFETFVVNDCGGLATRIDEGPWRVVTPAGIAMKQPSIAWVKPGEVYVARASRVGLMHVVDGVVSFDRIGDDLASIAVGLGPHDGVFASMEDGSFFGASRVFERTAGGDWVPFGPQVPFDTPVFVSLGRTLLLGTGALGLAVQLSEGLLCDRVYQPAVSPRYLVSRLTEVNGHIVAGLYVASGQAGTVDTVRLTVFDASLPAFCDGRGP